MKTAPQNVLHSSVYVSVFVAEMGSCNLESSFPLWLESDERGPTSGPLIDLTADDGRLSLDGGMKAS